MPDLVYCLGCGQSFDVTGINDPKRYPLIHGMCEACIRESRRPVQHVLAENERLKADISDLRAALEQAAVDMRGVAADSSAEIQDYLLDTACPRVREAMARSIERGRVSAS